MSETQAEEANLRRGAMVATAGTALSRITGFIRLGAMTFALGVAESRLADTYNLANTTPNILYELILGGVLSSVLVRVFIEVKKKEGEQEAWRFISRLTTAVMLVLGVICGLAIIAAPWIFRVYTFSSESQIQQRAGTLLLRLFIPQLAFYGLSTISTAVLNAHRKFGVPMFAPVLNNLIATGTLLLFAFQIPAAMRRLDEVGTGHLQLLGVGTTLGVVVMGLVPWIYMRRIGFRFFTGWQLRDPRFRRLARLSGYMLGYVAINQIGLAIAMILANRVQGGVSAYQYAYVFFQLPHGLLAVSIATAMFPGMTERAVANDYAGVAERIGTGLRQIAFFILPAIAGYIAIAPQLVRVLLEHGVTTQTSSVLIATVLRAWAGGIFFFSSFYLILRGFYALGDTKSPMLINLAALVVNIGVDLILFFGLDDDRLRIAGLAVGHGISYAVALIGGQWLLRKRLGGALMGKAYAGAVARMLIAATLTGVSGWLVVRLWQTGAQPSTLAQLGPVVGATLAGIIVYLGTARIFRLEEIKWLSSLVARR